MTGNIEPVDVSSDDTPLSMLPRHDTEVTEGRNLTGIQIIAHRNRATCEVARWYDQRPITEHIEKYHASQDWIGSCVLVHHDVGQQEVRVASVCSLTRSDLFVS